MVRQLIWVSISCGLMACAEPAEELGETMQFDRGGGCNVLDCDNSPELTHNGIWSFSVSGQNDVRGYSAVSEGPSGAKYAVLFKKVSDGLGRPITKKYKLTLENDRIVGRYGKTERLEGAGLIDARIQMQNAAGRQHDIVIKGVRLMSAPHYTDGKQIEVYRMLWARPDLDPATPGIGMPRPTLCNAPPPNGTPNNPVTYYGLQADENVVFAGDQFKIDSLTVEDAANDDIANFGCAGKTLSKLYLQRVTVHTQPKPDLARRLMFIKMWTADYCNDGRTWTATGAKLEWIYRTTIPENQFDHDVYPDPALLTTVDARWSANGATCLGTPRLFYLTDSTPDDPEDLTDLKDRVRASCPGRSMPDCVPGEGTDFGSAAMVSTNRSN